MVNIFKILRGDFNNGYNFLIIIKLFYLGYFLFFKLFLNLLKILKNNMYIWSMSVYTKMFLINFNNLKNYCIIMHLIKIP